MPAAGAKERRRLTRQGKERAVVPDAATITFVVYVNPCAHSISREYCHTLASDYYTQWMTEAQPYLVVGSAGGQAVCFAIGHRVDFDPMGNHTRPHVMDYIVTANAHRRRGYALALLRYMETTTMKQQTAMCFMPGSVELFERAGYKDVMGMDIMQSQV